MPDETTTEPTDRWNTFTEWLRKLLDHERYKIALPALTMAAFLAVALIGCKPVAILDGEHVTPENIGTVYEGKATDLQKRYAAWVAAGTQLELEAEALDASYDAAVESLTAQVAERNRWLEAGAGLLTAGIDGTLNPTSLIGTLLTLGLGATAVGAGLDARRKNRVIDRLKTTSGTGA